MTVVYLWKIKKVSIPLALFHMAFDRFLLKRVAGISFFKSIGTGSGEKFTPSDADPLVWGLIAVVDDPSLLDSSRVVKLWNKISQTKMRMLLEPISSHGAWGGTNPFTTSDYKTDGKIVAITRARIKWNKNLLFWRAVPAVTESLHSQPGLIRALGIGEAPIGLQGTLSIWDNAASLRTFAYKGEAHKGAITATEKHQWYTEELFARFALVEMRGSI
jgi:hypothetical protein